MVDDIHTFKSSFVRLSLLDDKTIIVKAVCAEIPLACILFGNNFDGFREVVLFLMSIHEQGVQFFTYFLNIVLLLLLVSI